MNLDARRYLLPYSGRRFEVWMAGEGPPVIVFHGWGLSGHPYRPALRALAEQGMRAIAPSLAVVKGRWSLNALGEAAAGIAMTIEATRPALVGHSFGGAVAIHLAHEQPEMAEALILINSVGVSPGLRRLARLALPGDHWRIGMHRPTARALLASAVRDRGMASLRGAAGWVLRNSLDEELETLGRRRFPSAVLWTRRDAILPLGLGERMAELLRCRLDLVEAEDGWPHRRPPDHDWPFRAPELFAAHVEEVLGRLAPHLQSDRWRPPARQRR